MDNNNTIGAADTIHIPLGLLALGLSFLFFSQIRSFNQASENVKWQNGMADKQIDGLKDNYAKLAKAIEDRKALVSQSEATQKQFTEVMRELDALAKGGDKDALQVMQTYGIKVSDPAGAAPTPPASDKKDEPKPSEKDKEKEKDKTP